MAFGLPGLGNRLASRQLLYLRAGWPKSGTCLAILGGMIIKALASYGIAKLLGFGIVGAVVIYALITMMGR